MIREQRNKTEDKQKRIEHNNNLIEAEQEATNIKT